MNLRKTVRIAMLLALSIVLGLIESSIPIINNIIPGIKLGIVNAVVIIVLYLYGFKEALFLSITRVFLLGMIRTGLFNIIFFFSLSGALFSLIFMSLSKNIFFIDCGISVIGSIYSIGQVIILYLLNNVVLFLFTLLINISIPTGIIVGMTARSIKVL